MHVTMPQEMEVWYLLPALRAEVSKDLYKLGMKQKDIATTLRVSEGAISQYLKDKRGTELSFTPADKQRILSCAKQIHQEPKEMTKHLYALSLHFKGSKALCNLHRAKDSSVPQDCDLCLKEK